jgi:hypothetical protein
LISLITPNRRLYSPDGKREKGDRSRERERERERETETETERERKRERETNRTDLQDLDTRLMVLGWSAHLEVFDTGLRSIGEWSEALGGGSAVHRPTCEELRSAGAASCSLRVLTMETAVLVGTPLKQVDKNLTIELLVLESGLEDCDEDCWLFVG